MRSILFYSLSILLMASCDNKKTDPALHEGPSKKGTAQLLENEIKKYPDSLLLKENLLQCYRDSGDYEKAIQTALDYLDKEPSNPRLHHMLGYLYFENADTLNAIKGFGKAYMIAPNNEDLILMAQLSAMKGLEVAKGISDTLYHSKDPLLKKQGAFISGLYHQSKKEYKEALRQYDLCLQLDYTFMEAYVEKTNILLLTGQTTAAAETIQKAVTLQNNFIQGYLLLGKCRERLQQKDKAAEAYRRVLLYQPDAEEALEGLSRCEQ